VIRSDADQTTLQWSGNLRLQAAIFDLHLAYIIVAADGRPHMFINGEEVSHPAAQDMGSAMDVLAREMWKRFGGQRQ
jgi:hypothetical protein